MSEQAPDPAPDAAAPAPEAAPYKPEREANGGYKKGVSGNPGGRPKGIGWHMQQRLELRKAVTPLYGALFRQALAGDTKASEILLSRVLPAARVTDDESGFTLPSNISPADQSRRVLAAMAKGTLTAGQAADQMAVISAGLKIIEQSELEERLRRLEGATNDTAHSS